MASNKRSLILVLISVGAIILIAAIRFGGLLRAPGPAVAKSGSLTLLYQGSREGAIEPCGCESKPWGGLDREWNALTAIRKESANHLYVDAGNLLAPQSSKLTPSEQLAKATSLVAMLNEMGLDAFSPGPYDYNLGAEHLLKLAQSAKFAFVSSNVRVLGEGPQFAETILQERGGIRYALLGIAPVEPLSRPDLKLKLESPETALKRLLPALKDQADVVIVLSSLGVEENGKLLEQFPEIQILVGADAEIGLEEPFWIAGKSLLVDGEKSGYLLGRLDVEWKFPLRGFTSPELVEKNQAVVKKLQARVDKGEASAKGQLERLKLREPYQELPGGTVYRNQLIRLTKENFGTPNRVTEMIQAERERVRKAALK